MIWAAGIFLALLAVLVGCACWTFYQWDKEMNAFYEELKKDDP